MREFRELSNADVAIEFAKLHQVFQEPPADIPPVSGECDVAEVSQRNGGLQLVAFRSWLISVLSRNSLLESERNEASLLDVYAPLPQTHHPRRLIIRENRRSGPYVS